MRPSITIKLILHRVYDRYTLLKMPSMCVCLIYSLKIKVYKQLFIVLCDNTNVIVINIMHEGLCVCIS